MATITAKKSVTTFDLTLSAKELVILWHCTNASGRGDDSLLWHQIDTALRDQGIDPINPKIGDY